MLLKKYDLQKSVAHEFHANLIETPWMSFANTVNFILELYGDLYTLSVPGRGVVGGRRN